MENWIKKMSVEDINFAGIIASAMNFKYMKEFTFPHSHSKCHSANNNWYQSQDSLDIFHFLHSEGATVLVFTKVNARRVVIIPVSESTASFRTIMLSSIIQNLNNLLNWV